MLLGSTAQVMLLVRYYDIVISYIIGPRLYLGIARNVHAHVSELIQVTITSPIIKGKPSTPAQFPSYRITCEFLNKNDTYY